MKVKLRRIIIFCQDAAKLAAFYQEHFGLKAVGPVDKNWTVLKAGSTEIAFHISNSSYLQPGAQKFKGANSNVKFVLEIQEDLDEFRQQLVAKKVKMKAITRVPGLPYIWCDGKDPEGNVFQIMQTL